MFIEITQNYTIKPSYPISMLKKLGDVKRHLLASAFPLLVNVLFKLKMLVRLFDCFQSCMNQQSFTLYPKGNHFILWLIDQVSFIQWFHMRNIDELDSSGGQFIEQTENVSI